MKGFIEVTGEYYDGNNYRSDTILLNINHISAIYPSYNDRHNAVIQLKSIEQIEYAGAVDEYKFLYRSISVEESRDIIKKLITDAQ